MTGSVVELQFDVSDTEFLLVEASGEGECTVRIEEVHQRSDGRVLEYLVIEGADAGRLSELVAADDRPIEIRVLSEDGDTTLVEVISDSSVATALADNRTRVTDITATAGNGRLVAEVPAHVEASTVIDSFLDQYPDATLLARRETDQEAPALTEAQFQERVLGDLTNRQLQALRTAHAAGYFDRPRQATKSEIAADLGIADSTLSEHLRVAQGKVFDRLFDRV